MLENVLLKRERERELERHRERGLKDVVGTML